MSLREIPDPSQFVAMVSNLINCVIFDCQSAREQRDKVIYSYNAAYRRIPGSEETTDLSNEPLTFEKFAEINRDRCTSPSGFNHQLYSWSLSDWFTALIGEVGEAANIAKKLNRVRDGITGNKETETELREKLRSEIADAFIYIDLLAQSQGFSLEEAVVETFNKKSDQIGSPYKI